MHSTSEAAIGLLKPAKLIPLLHIERVEDAVPLAQTLVDAGLRVMEVGWRTQAAANSIAAILNGVSGAIPIAGNIMTSHDLSAAMNAGARLACSPGAPDDVLEIAVEKDIPFVPGIATPTELMRVIRKGFHCVKFFPAVPFGGAGALRAFLAPFPKISFVPTGGTGEVEYGDWLDLPNVIAIGGSWLAPRAEIEGRNWEQIGARARYALSKYKSRRQENVKSNVSQERF